MSKNLVFLIDIKKEINKELGRITDKAQRSTRKTDLKKQN